MNAPLLRQLGSPFRGTAKGANKGPDGQFVRTVDSLEWRKAAMERVEQLHDAMQAIIAALDAMDGDPDLEPSLAPGRDASGYLVMDDREGGDPLDEGEPNDWDDEDNGDEEPSLGWGQFGAALNKSPRWANGVDNDE